MRYKMKNILCLLILVNSFALAQNNYVITPKSCGELCIGQLIDSLDYTKFRFVKEEYTYSNGYIDSVIFIYHYIDSCKLCHTRIPLKDYNKNTKISNLYIDSEKLHFKSGMGKGSSIRLFQNVIDQIDFYDKFSGTNYLAQYRISIEYNESNYILVVFNFEEIINSTNKDTVVSSISLHQRPFGK